MEKRKNPEKELKNKQGLFFNMGLLIAMMLCVSAFEYETRDIVVSVPDLKEEKAEIYLPPVTTQDMPEPPKPKVKLPDPSRLKAAEPDAKELQPTLDLIEPEIPTHEGLTLVYLEPAPVEEEVAEAPERNKSKAKSSKKSKKSHHSSKVACSLISKDSHKKSASGKKSSDKKKKSKVRVYSES